MKYLCPVCGYNQLNAPPQDDLICPCCGTHFDYDDYAYSYAELRDAWLHRGANWFSRRIPKPVGWSAITQLRNIGYECTYEDQQKIITHELALTTAVFVVSMNESISAPTYSRSINVPAWSMSVINETSLNGLTVSGGKSQYA